MSRILRTDEELLKCAPPVNIAMFTEAKDNMIAQDYGKYRNKCKYLPICIIFVM